MDNLRRSFSSFRKPYRDIKQNRNHRGGIQFGNGNTYLCRSLYGVDNGIRGKRTKLC